MSFDTEHIFASIGVMCIVWILFDGFAKSAKKFDEWGQIVKHNRRRQ